jgi:hypothetical protein
MGGKPVKKIRSFTLCEKSILKLKKHADKEHKGNLSEAMRRLILDAVPTTLDDYAHRQAEEERKWRGTGKCNPNLGGYPCVPCWGENAIVRVKQALVMRDGRLREEDVIDVAHS